MKLDAELKDNRCSISFEAGSNSPKFICKDYRDCVYFVYNEGKDDCKYATVPKYSNTFKCDSKVAQVNILVRLKEIIDNTLEEIEINETN